MKKTRIIESMTKITLPNGYTVRVWRNESKLEQHYDNSDINSLALQNVDLTKSELTEALCKLPRVNAVEVLNSDGSGILIYPEWP